MHIDGLHMDCGSGARSLWYLRKCGGFMEFNSRRMHIVTRAGFSLVEIMVSVGILMAVTLGILVAMRSALKSSSTAEWTIEQAAMLKEAQNVLASPTLCTNALQGTTISAVGAAPLPISLTPATCTYPPAAPVASNCVENGQGIYTNASYDSKINIKSITLEKVMPVDAALNSYQADVVIQSQLAGTGAGGQNQNIYGNSEFD